MKALLLIATIIFAGPFFTQISEAKQPTLFQTLLKGEAQLSLASNGCGPWQRNGRCWLVRQCCVTRGVCAPQPCSTTRCTEQFRDVCN